MADIKFGVIYSRLHPVVPIPKFAEAAEGLGFGSLWVTEGLANEMPALDILMALGGLVHHTNSITVGTCVLLLPLRNPAILAKEVATLDYLSGGRVVLGVGVGGSDNSNPASFQVCGVSVKERGARCDEGLEVMTKLWTGHPVSHSGRFYKFEDIAMEPGPVQQPHPSIWAGGAAEGVLRRTARWCDGFVPTNVSSKEYVQLWDRIERYGEQYGRDASRITKAVHLYYCLAGSREEARAIAQDTLTKRYGYKAKLHGDDRYAFGTVEDCIETIESFVRAGVTHFVFNTARPLPEVLGQVERLASEVMPHFK
ncbi:MAG: LLM class flavin-dependent oxidoreductase [Dehalococcoidia bacterium]